MFLLPVQICHFISDGNLTLESNEVLEINTTAPYVNCSPSCNYQASHENRSSSGYTYPVAVITFTGDITFKSGSLVIVFGEYALSVISLNGSFDIQTDINMTCGKKVLNATCLGGFTQPEVGKLVGLYQSVLLHRGKGSIPIMNLFSLFVVRLLLVISNHGIYTVCSCYSEKKLSFNRNND